MDRMANEATAFPAGKLAHGPRGKVGPMAEEVRTITFTVPGRPVPKARPRVYRGKAHTPASTLAFEKSVRVLALAELRGRGVIDGAVKVAIQAQYAVPKSYSKAKALQAIRGEIRPRGGDIDNIAKSVLDGLQDAAFKDDASVAKLFAGKCFGHADQTIVTVEALA